MHNLLTFDKNDYLWTNMLIFISRNNRLTLNLKLLFV